MFDIWLSLSFLESRPKLHSPRLTAFPVLNSSWILTRALRTQVLASLAHFQEKNPLLVCRNLKTLEVLVLKTRADSEKNHIQETVEELE